FVTGLIGNLAANVCQRTLDRLSPRAEEFFRNHHLTELTGQCIRLIIRSFAAGGRDPEDLRHLNALASKAPAAWRELAPSGDPRTRSRFKGILEPSLHEFIADARKPALRADAWHEFLIAIDHRNIDTRFRDRRLSGQLAKALQQRFGEALREALKRDFVSGGE